MCKLGALGHEYTVKRNYQTANLDIKPLKRQKLSKARGQRPALPLLDVELNPFGMAQR